MMTARRQIRPGADHSMITRTLKLKIKLRRLACQLAPRVSSPAELRPPLIRTCDERPDFVKYDVPFFGEVNGKIQG
jgi:hypothetical protein